MRYRNVLAGLTAALLTLGVAASGCGRSSDVVGGTDKPAAGGAPSVEDLDFEPCAEVREQATLVPVNMYVLVDRSGSMDDMNKWTDTEAAFGAFFQNDEAGALRVALRFWPDDGCEDPDPDDMDTNCDAAPCATPLVTLGSLSDAGHQQDLIDAFASRDPNGATPMSAALEGGVRWARARITDTPDEQHIILVVSDGEPNGCVEDPMAIAQIASDAAADDILTYAVGLQGSNEAVMNGIAAAGGTTDAFFIGAGNTEQDLVNALLDIAGRAVSCTFGIPDPSEPGDTLDPELVRLEYASDGGAPDRIPQVADASECDPDGGWFYDANDPPETITLCTSTCGTVQSDQAAEVSVALGCACETDPDCPGDNICVAGSCIDPCETDEDCPATFICLEGRCVPEEGGECTIDPDCPFGLFCIGGQCTRGGALVGRQEAVQGGAFNCSAVPPTRSAPYGAVLLLALGLLLRRRSA